MTHAKILELSTSPSYDNDINQNDNDMPQNILLKY